MFDTWTLVLGLIFSSIGLGYFIYGRKQSHFVTKYCGIALMIFPYFITDKYTVLVVGIVLMAIPKFVQFEF